MTGSLKPRTLAGRQRPPSMESLDDRSDGANCGSAYSSRLRCRRACRTERRSCNAPGLCPGTRAVGRRRFEMFQYQAVRVRPRQGDPTVMSCAPADGRARSLHCVRSAGWWPTRHCRTPGDRGGEWAGAAGAQHDLHRRAVSRDGGLLGRRRRGRCRHSRRVVSRPAYVPSYSAVRRMRAAMNAARPPQPPCASPSRPAMRRRSTLAPAVLFDPARGEPRSSPGVVAGQPPRPRGLAS